jgi:hypothetical protein
LDTTGAVKLVKPNNISLHKEYKFKVKVTIDGGEEIIHPTVYNLEVGCI